MRKTYVEFSYPGVLFAETSTKEVASRDVNALRPFPKGAFCMRFYDIESGTLNGAPVESGELSPSARTYLGGEVFRREDLPQGDAYRILRSNAESNGYTRLIRCVTGNWQPLNDDDVVVAADHEALTGGGES